ncbi:MAG: glycine oxidase ThiO [Bacilli bacterium]|nr:glycine oxidase ThiO [Bacilli bacterium]
MSTSSYDTIIIGGGIIGACIAWQLAQKNRKVLVLEAGRIGCGASHAGAGMLGAQVEMDSPGPLYNFSIFSRSLFDELTDQLKDESHIDSELDRTGMFRIATSESDREELINRCAWQTASGQSAEWIEPEQIPAELKNRIGYHYGALFLPHDYQVRNPQYLKALATSAMKHDARIIESTAVRRLLTNEGQPGKVVGVQTDTDLQFFADQVVLAAGAWSGVLARSLGINLGVYPIKGQAVLLESPTHFTPYTLFTHGTYIVPKHTGHTYIGATETADGFDARPLARNVRTLLTSAGQLAPDVEDMEFVDSIAGLRPASHDGLPYIGSIPGWEGLYAATGHWRNGILLSAGTGAVMADLLLGHTAQTDISAFDPGRK